MRRLLAALALALTLAACGGGSTSTPAPAPAPAAKVDLSTLNLIQTMPPAYSGQNLHFVSGGYTFSPMVVLDQGGYYDVMLYVFDQSGAVKGGAFLGTATLSSNPAPVDLPTFMQGVAARLQAALNPNANPAMDGIWTVTNPSGLSATSVVTGTPTTVADIPRLAWTSDTALAQDVSWGLLFLQLSVVNGSIVVSYP